MACQCLLSPFSFSIIIVIINNEYCLLRIWNSEFCVIEDCLHVTLINLYSFSLEISSN